MTALIIDTSREYALIALSREGDVLLEHTAIHDNHLSKNLLPSINNLFEQANLLPKQLDYISIGVGPGSYTGTRVGAAVAKSLSFALDIPLISFCSLLAYLPEESGTYASVVDGKGGDLYLLRGHKDKKNINYTLPAKMLRAEALAAALQGVAWIATPDPEPFKTLFSAWHWVPFTPNLRSAAAYSHQQFQSGERTPSEIIYLYNIPFSPNI
jgi:tRNA threonylcarbamoyladenosine biosynthesis protein TsaB